MRRPWKLAHEADLVRLSRFLEEREWECVSFSGHLLENGSWKLPRRYRKRVFLLPNPKRSGGEETGLLGAVLQTANGFVYPVFDSPEADQPTHLDALARELGSGFGRVSTLMGVYEDVLALEMRLPESPSYAVDYDILCFAETEDRELLRRRPPGEGVVVRRATPQDLSALLPLQEAYEREEVLLPGRSVNTGLTMRMLQHSIEKQLVLLASLQGRIVAKAATNARGGRYDQLGGVYTVPEFRGRGIGSLVVANIARLIIGQHRGVSLFVKKDNVPAQRLYARLGFSHMADLRICYYA
jgi:uncharacterized protein